MKDEICETEFPTIREFLAHAKHDWLHELEGHRKALHRFIDSAFDDLLALLVRIDNGAKKEQTR